MAKRYETARGRRRTVTATDAAKNFGALVDRVRETGLAYVVERKGRAIAEIGPVSGRRCTFADLARWFEGRRPLPETYVTAVRDHLEDANRPRIPAARWQP